MRILVVDDDPRVLSVCVDALTDMGYPAEAFPRGEPALEAVADEPPDLLVLNWDLPGIDGVEVTRRARQLQQGLRILMITGHPAEAAGPALGAGVLQVLTKPFTVDAFATAVRSALQG